MAKKITVGYWYGLGIHFGICHGPVDAVQQITIDDRVAWTGNITATHTGTDYTQGSASNRSNSLLRLIPQPAPGVNDPIFIDQPELFGGIKKEGGLVGRLGVCMGDPTQGKNAFLQSMIGANIPAFRGILGLVWNGRVSANNPYLKPWAVKVKRILQGWHGGAAWYSAKATITNAAGDDMNPAHMVYQTHTDPDWGMGYPAESINDSNFRAVADTLYNEGFGLSMLWNQQGTIESFQSIVMNHIGGIFRNNPTTGLFEIKLIRNDYNPATLPSFDTSNSTLESFQRVAIGETVNEVTVTYTDPVTSKNTSVTVHNLANIQSQGGIVPKSIHYSGIRSATLAARVAMRDLTALSTPLAKIRLTTNRTAWDILPGDVFKLDWTPLGISGVVYRVLNVSMGTLESGRIQIDAAEDVFGLPSATYVGQEAVGWVEPGSVPAASPVRLVTEMPYWDLARNLSQADLAYLTPTSGYLAVTSKAPSSDSLDAILWTRTSGGTYAETGEAPHCPTAVLNGAIGKTETAIPYLSGVSLELLEGAGYLVMNGEYMRLDAINPTLATLTVARGALDTVPKNHADGEVIFFADGFMSSDAIEYSETEIAQAKIQTQTGRGVLDLSITPEDSVTMAARQARPYPPGKLRINGAAYPVAIMGDLVVTWAHRDRTLQTAYVVTQDEANIGPEAGVTYTVNVYGDGGTLLHTEAGVTGTSYTLAGETSPASTRYLRIYITATNGDTYAALQEIEIASVTGGADITSSGMATSQSTYFAADGSTFAKAIDNNTTTATAAWVTDGTALPQWGYVDLGTTQAVKEVRLLCQNADPGPNRAPKDFKIQGSPDGTTWTDITSFTNVTGWAKGTWKAFSVGSPSYSSQLRVTVEAVRDALASWQKHDHTFDRAGLGLSLGKYLGGV